MAKSQTTRNNQPPLGHVSKRGRDAISAIMAGRDGKLNLQGFLARRWNVEDYLRSEGVSRKVAAQRAADDLSQLASEHPNWSQDKIRVALSLSYLTVDLKETAVARRFALDEPGELAQRLSILSRLRWLDCMIHGYTYVDFDFVVEAFAVRDLAVAQHLMAGEPAVSRGKLEFLELCSLAVHAIGRKDLAKVRSIGKKMGKEKLRPWQQGIHTWVMGIAEEEPQQVANGLLLLLEGMHKMQQKDDLEEAINLPAQGLYRIAEWISPELVAGFDVAQPFPWDAAFHAWCQNHPGPLAGLDLTGIAPALHRAVVLLQPPPNWSA